MTAREFLNRPFLLNNKINDKKIKLGFYRELSCSPSSPGFEEHFSSNRNTKAQLDVWATGQVYYSIVVIENEAIVGFGDIEKTGCLDRLFVHADYQDKGIATVICNKLEQTVQGNITTHASVIKEEYSVIREFQKVDIEQVMQIWLNGNIDAHFFIPKEYWESNFKTVREQIVQAEVYVYEENDRIQGFIGVQENYVAGIFVKKEYRSKGIGKSLLDYVKLLYNELILNVHKKNIRAIAFYEREGFSAVSEQLDEDTGEVDIVMQMIN